MFFMFSKSFRFWFQNNLQNDFQNTFSFNLKKHTQMGGDKSEVVHLMGHIWNCHTKHEYCHKYLWMEYKNVQKETERNSYLGLVSLYLGVPKLSQHSFKRLILWVLLNCSRTVAVSILCQILKQTERSVDVILSFSKRSKPCSANYLTNI